MAETATIEAKSRQDTGKGAARKMRASGRIPAVVYGPGREPEPLSVAGAELDSVLQKAGGGSTVVELSVDGKPLRALIREIQRHPTTKTITHVDFYEIHAGQRLTVDVPIALVGSPDGVRNAGGVLEQFLRELTIDVLPRHIPDRIEIDVTDLKVAASIHVDVLSVENAKILTDPTTTVCTVAPPRVEEAPTPEVLEEEEEVSEPELIRKPKPEEAGEVSKGESSEE